MTVRKFETTFVRPEGKGTWTFFPVPFDVGREYGTKARVQVRGHDRHPAVRGEHSFQMARAGTS